MSGQTRRTTDRSTGAPAASSTSTTTSRPTDFGSNSANLANEASAPEQVVLYMTLNNTTHKDTEIPESMSALKQAEAEGLGHKELLPISDPYWTKQRGGGVSFHDETYDHAFGKEAADRVTWWHGEKDLQEGQVKVDGKVLTLGTASMGKNDWGGEELVPADVTKLEQNRQDWKTVLMTLGMDEKYADATIGALLGKGEDGRLLESGPGATNELVQYIMVMYRAELGHINVTDIVLSGHHYTGGRGIWGEKSGQDHVYDDTSDLFAFDDMKVLAAVFPKAYAQVKSVQLAACNTHDLGQYDANGDSLSTNDFLQSMFPSVETTSYWKEDLAPVASVGAETNGEWLLDATRYQNNKENAIRDSRHNDNPLKRSVLNDASGKVEEISMKTNKASYGGQRMKGLRGSNKDFDQRADLQNYLFTMQALENQKKKPGS